MLSLISLYTPRGHPSHLLVYPLNCVIFASQKKVIYTQAKGLTEAQKATLKSLGAIEDPTRRL
jgi:hypothetical protein